MLDELNDSTWLRRNGLTPRKDRYKGTYLQSDYSSAFNAGGVRHEVLAGFDASHESGLRFQNNGYANVLGTRPATTIGTPDDGAGLVGTGNAPAYRPSSNYSANAFGVYVQDLVQVAPAWTLLGGGRWDHFEGTFGQQPINATTGVITPSSASISESPFSYRAGVLYQPTTTASFHVSYGTSFNTSADTYQYVSPQTANTPPEKSRNIEIGAKLDWFDNQLSTRVALFRTEKYNERTTDADYAGDSFLLSGKRHSQGVEFDVAGRLTPKLEVYLSAAWTPQATIDSIGSAQANVIGSRVGLTPKASGAAWLSYQATPRLRVAGGVHGASKNYPLQGTTGAASTNAHAPGYVVADAMLEYQVTPDVIAQLNVTNITNKVYGDQLYPAFSILGAPRTVQLAVAYRF
jgi:catecholate siderophore receptor